MTRIMCSLGLIFLTGCSSSPPPSPQAAVRHASPTETDPFGQPKSLIRGRVVDSKGHGLGGVEVRAGTSAEGWGRSESTDHVGTTAADGTWSWAAPSDTMLDLTFSADGYPRTGKGTMWLRRGQTYDLGVQVLPCNLRVRFRVIDLEGRILTQHLDPEVELDADGWGLLCFEERDQFLDHVPDRLEEFAYDQWHEEDDSPIVEIVTPPLHSILHLVYPDGSPVVGAVVTLGESELSTNGNGEIPIFKGEVNEAGVSVSKGDFTAIIQLAERSGERETHVFPRGGDLDLELIWTEGNAFAMGWGVSEINEESCYTENNFNFIGRIRARLENLAPGEHRFEPWLIYGDDFEAPSPFTVEIESGEVTALRVPIHPRPSRQLNLLVTTPAGHPASQATVEFGAQKGLTDQDGRISIEVFERVDTDTFESIEIEHPQWGYYSGQLTLGSDRLVEIRLLPWARINFRAVDEAGKTSTAAKLVVDHRHEALHVRFYQGEPPWYLETIETNGELETLLRGACYAFEVHYHGWQREEGVCLEPGESRSIEWSLPPLREISVRVIRDGQPVEGSVSLEQSPAGWEGWHSVELDVNGRATLYTAVLDPKAPLTIRWSKFRGGSRTWTAVVADPITLEIEN